MVKAQNNAFRWNIGGEEIVHDTEVGIVSLDPDFAVVDAKVEDDMLHSPFIVPPRSQPQVVMSLCIEDEMLGNLFISGTWGLLLRETAVMFEQRLQGAAVVV